MDLSFEILPFPGRTDACSEHARNRFCFLLFFYVRISLIPIVYLFFVSVLQTLYRLLSVDQPPGKDVKTIASEIVTVQSSCGEKTKQIRIRFPEEPPPLGGTTCDTYIYIYICFLIGVAVLTVFITNGAPRVTKQPDNLVILFLYCCH